MDRRRYLAALGSAGLAATAGCTALRGPETLADPAVRGAGGRRSLEFVADGREVGSLGVTGAVTAGAVELRTELWHRDGTRIESIELRVWMPDGGDTPADVAVVSPVEGDASPPPSLALSAADRVPGAVLTVTDLDDLADETVSTLGLLVWPASATATALAIDATVGLASGDLAAPDYTLDGRLDLTFPALAEP